MTDKIKRYNFVSELKKAIQAIDAPVGKIKSPDLKRLVESVFQAGVTRAACGERVRFPLIGALSLKAVKERPAGIWKNPFTGKDTMVKPRAASQKPRWSFPKAIKKTFTDSKAG